MCDETRFGRRLGTFATGAESADARMHMKKRRPVPSGLILLPLIAALCVSCSLPRVYKLSVQQGNVITQEMIDGLTPGMTHEQVAFVMGQPVIRNPFDDRRWDYVYTLRVPGFVDETVKMSLFFTDGQLTHFTGDFRPSEADDEDASTEAATAANPPPGSVAQSSDRPRGS